MSPFSRKKVYGGELKRQHINAVPDVFPAALLESQGNGTRKSKIIINGTETLPLGGIANSTTVFCNDGGKYSEVVFWRSAE
jgi:hypothetical protein